MEVGNEYHIPVLYIETLENMVKDKDGLYMDCNFGGGSHSEGILKMLDKGV